MRLRGLNTSGELSYINDDGDYVEVVIWTYKDQAC